MTFPVPTLDHVVVNVQDRMDEAQAIYERLGFTLTPRGYHTLGSINHLAILGTDYFELIGVPAADAARSEIMAEPIGLNGLVFGMEDEAAVYAALISAGVPATSPKEFSRPVTLADGSSRDATFRTIHVNPAEGRPGRLYFCRHFTRDLVWRDEWRHHANGAIAVVRAVIAAADPAILGTLFTQMFGADRVRPIAGGCRLVTGLQHFDILNHDAVADLLGDAAAAPAGRPYYMAALTLRTLSLDQTAAALATVPHHRDANRILVPATATMGCPLEFVP